MNREEISNGATARTTPAEISAISTPFCDCNPARATGIVAVVGPVRINANRNSFQARMKPNTPAAARPGSEIGKTMRQKALQTVAPSVMAAHSSSTGTPSKKPIMIQVRNGRLMAP